MFKVSLYKRPDSQFWHMQYRDPSTGEKHRKSSGKTRKDLALKVAGQWEKELNDVGDIRDGRSHWEDFRENYETLHVAALAEKTEKRICSCLNGLENRLKINRVSDITTSRLSQYAQMLRDEERSENTIKSHLRHIGGMLNWAKSNGYLKTVPELPKIPRARKTNNKVMRGRPITTEEFERMLDSVEKVIRKPNKGRSKEKPEPDHDRIPSWKFLLRGLWLSGLRLAEALELSWDDETQIHIDMSLRYPMFRVLAESEKGHQDRILPMAPEFAQFLETVPEARRRGFVFHPLPLHKNRSERLCEQTVGRTITAIGKKANVVVDMATGKFASAHDFRRSFGERWSDRVMPKTLAELMRHSSVETTMKYYVGNNAMKTAAVLWDAFETGTQTGTQNDEQVEKSEAKQN